MIRPLFLACLILGGCSGQPKNAATESGEFRAEHASREKVDLAVAEAINEPGGGDYAKAVAITKAAELPQATKDFETGQLIVGSYQGKVAERPDATLAQGLELLEKAALVPGETASVAPEQLRLIFERGVGAAPVGIAIDPVIASCWGKLENHGAGDPATCVSLRRQRMPQVGAP